MDETPSPFSQKADYVVAITAIIALESIFYPALPVAQAFDHLGFKSPLINQM